MKISEHVDEFKRKVIASGNEPDTADTYGNSMALLMVHYQEKYDTPLHISFRDMEDYIIHLVDEDYSASYINSFVASAKRFYAINGQPQKCAKLQYRDNPVQSPNVLTYDECMKMCRAPIYLKHQLIINLLYYGAFRRGELIDLKMDNISKDGKITIIHGKFGKSRVVPIPKHVMQMVWIYCDQFSPKVYLFDGDGGRPQYSAGSIKNILKNTARVLGIHKRIYPHLMRSSRSTILLDNGASYAYVSELLGHKDIETTRKYYHKLTIGAMQSQFEEIDKKLEDKKIESPLEQIMCDGVSAIIPKALPSVIETKSKIIALTTSGKTYSIDLNGKKYSLKEKNGKIVEASEGAGWSEGVLVEKAISWFEKKGGKVSVSS